MLVVRFRSKEEHKDLLKKVKKMKEYAEMIEDCLVEVVEDDDEDYRYRDEDDYENEPRMRGGRYGYRRGGGSRSRM